MESEIMTFETIVLILMNFENTTIETILNYFSKFAHIFKNQIDNAIYKLQKGTDEALSGTILNDTKQKTNEEDALNELIEKVEYKPFKNLIKNLIKSEDISMDQAFTNLSSNRNEYAKDRELEDEKIVIQRVRLARNLSWIAMFIVLFCYIISPFMIVSYYHLDNLTNELNVENSNY